MTSITSRGYVLPKRMVDSADLQQLREDLTLRANWDPDNNYGPKPPKFRVYLENPDKFLIPSYYGHLRFGPAATTDFGTMERRCCLDFEGTLKTSIGQDQVAAAAMEAFSTVGGGILCMEPGAGKTTVSLYLACQMKLKTMVIVHKQFLMDQWRERIQTFVPTASIGKLQGDVMDVDHDIVLAMLQSVSMRSYPKEVFQGLGLLVVDEAHCICAPTFSQALLRINAPYKLAVSATPERKDGLGKVIEWFMGPMFYRKKREPAAGTSVDVVWFHSDAFGQPAPTARNGKLCMSTMITVITEDRERNILIKNKAVLAVAQGRKVLILSDRRQHCMDLATLLESEKFATGLYMGGMKAAQLKESETCNVIIGTYSQAREGLDIPALNTLILASPKSDIEQASGRIMRHAADNVKTHCPLIIDIVDKWACCPAQFSKRKTFYQTCGFSMHNNTNDEQQKTLHSFGFVQE